MEAEEADMVHDMEFRRAALDMMGGRGCMATAKALGVSKTTLMRWSRDARGGAPKDRGRSRADKERAAAVARERGAAAAAEECGVSVRTVFRWAAELKGGLGSGGAAPSGAGPRGTCPGAAEGGTVGSDARRALPDDPELLKRMVEDLRMENDVLREVAKVLKKGRAADPAALTNREKALVARALEGTYSKSSLARSLRIAESSLYYQLSRLGAPERRPEVRALVREGFGAGRGAYGAARVHDWIRDERGVTVSEKVVRRVMREEGLVAAVGKRRRPYSSYKAGMPGAAPNLLLREDGTHDFRSEAPGERLVTDITEFKAGGAKVYLSAMVDLFDGKVVAWRAGTSPTGELAALTLEDALDALPGGSRPLVHSDRGFHYRTKRWLGVCRRRGVVRSMSRKATSPDNAACEGFFGTLKVEHYHGRDWSGAEPGAFIEALGDYIAWYNRGRIRRFEGQRAMETIEGRRERLGV